MLDKTLFSPEIISRLKSGAIGVMPTDTLYGLVGSALLPETVERIYETRGRDRDNPMILLIQEIPRGLCPGVNHTCGSRC